MKLLFRYGFDDIQQEEAEARGYLADVLAEDEQGRRYALVFWDLGRLGQDLEEETQQNKPFIAEPGMVVVSRVTLTNILAAVDKLEREKFFAGLVPTTLGA